MERIPGPGEIYQHFKGKLYRIVAIAEHSESAEKLVIYQALYDECKIYARPLEMFLEEVDRQKYPQAEAKYRFTRLPLVDIAKEQPDHTNHQNTNAAGQTAADTEANLSIPAAWDEPAVNNEEEFELDPMLLSFLDADSYERKLEIFDSLHARIDQSMLNTIAVSLDLELTDGDIEEQYLTLRNCMLTLERYECNRLR